MATARRSSRLRARALADGLERVAQAFAAGIELEDRYCSPSGVVTRRCGSELAADLVYLDGRPPFAASGGARRPELDRFLENVAEEGKVGS
jgi:hypothetical protein